MQERTKGGSHAAPGRTTFERERAPRGRQSARDRLDARLAIDMLSEHPKILDVARTLTSRISAPVLGGVAVFLHGYRRTTRDLDFYSAERHVTDTELRAAGAVWDARRREHVYDGVRIHTVTPHDAGHVVRGVSTLEGIRVVSLKDLIAIKLRTGLNNLDRSKDLADVVELIRAVGLDRSFAAKLPKDLRAEFRKFVGVVRAAEASRKHGPAF